MPWHKGRCVVTPTGILKRRGKKMFLNGSFAKSPRVAHTFNHGWWRLTFGGWWRLAVGGWRLVVVGGGWWLAVGGPVGRS